MSITNNAGCSVADCPVDLGPNCRVSTFQPLGTSLTLRAGPAALIGPYDSSGYPVGCKSACEADLDGDPSKHFKHRDFYYVKV